MISSRGWFPFECHEAGTNLSARKTGFLFSFNVRGSCAKATKPLGLLPGGDGREGCSFQPSAKEARGWGGSVAQRPGDPRERARREASRKRTPFLQKGWQAALPAEQMSPRRMQLRQAIAGRQASRLPRPLAPHQPLISPAHSPMN